MNCSSDQKKVSAFSIEFEKKNKNKQNTISIEKNVKIGIKQLLRSVKKGVKTTYRWVCNGMQFSAMVKREVEAANELF